MSFLNFPFTAKLFPLFFFCSFFSTTERRRRLKAHKAVPVFKSNERNFFAFNLSSFCHIRNSLVSLSSGLFLSPFFTAGNLFEKWDEFSRFLAIKTDMRSEKFSFSVSNNEIEINFLFLLEHIFCDSLSSWNWAMLRARDDNPVFIYESRRNTETIPNHDDIYFTKLEAFTFPTQYHKSQQHLRSFVNCYSTKTARVPLIAAKNSRNERFVPWRFDKSSAINSDRFVRINCDDLNQCWAFDRLFLMMLQQAQNWKWFEKIISSDASWPEGVRGNWKGDCV